MGKGKCCSGLQASIGRFVTFWMATSEKNNEVLKQRNVCISKYKAV